MIRYAFIVLLIFFQYSLCAQQRQDSTNIKPVRLAFVAGTQALTTGFMLYGLNEAWYEDYESSPFHAKNDLGEWCQMDKLGHVYAAYSFAGPLSGMYTWAGLDRKKSVLYGSAAGVTFLTVIEVLDGVSAEWGFSWGDMGANILGGALYATQELAWQEQRIQLKFSALIRNYSPAELANRADQVYGTSPAERILKDYNAQTYWLSVSVHDFYKRWPKWLNIAVGYGGEDMYGAYYNTWKDVNGKYHDRADIQRYRQFYISPDINLSAIKTRSKTINAILEYMTIKIPAPTLEYNTNGKFIFRALYF